MYGFGVKDMPKNVQKMSKNGKNSKTNGKKWRKIARNIQYRPKKWLGNVHKGRPTILGHFGHTYLVSTHVLCFLYYAFYLSPIFAEIPTYPKIGRPL